MTSICWWLYVSVALAISMLWPRMALAENASVSPYNTSRVLAQQDNACPADLNDCRIVRLEPRSVNPGKSVVIPMQCPAGYPYPVGWDARRHEHISIGLVPGRPDGRVPRLVVGNNADEPGNVTIFLGCARQDHRATAMPQLLSAVPTNRAALRQSQ
ncbi:hypothetical protein [Roseicella sp. DB1501]|uniref:hypothetical protein n=1 Tax=Roseicella sp. DB1501 TaxID=2730925 RepID=UPI001492A56A|nr:hypothetical protein [Roseicella sp. DB1501]NOG74117.1 hypothetical protein [Roseicella sp. DB1501]